MRTTRRIAESLAVLCTFVAVAGCAPSTTESENAPSPSADAPVDYDVARLAEVEGDFPPGFIPFPFRLGKQRPETVDQVSAVVSYGRPFLVDPPQCRPLLKLVDGRVGADTNGTRADGPNKQSIAVSAIAPVTVPAGLPANRCERMTFEVPGAPVPTRGMANRITAPTIDGATTSALEIHTDGYPEVEYDYAAILDGRVYVRVAARLSPGFAAQPVLTELLVTAQAAVRGQLPPPGNASARPAAPYDVSRIAEVQAGLPPGFEPVPSPPSKLLPQLVDGVSTVVSYGKPLVVEPAQCGVLLKPVDAKAGADTTGFRGDAPERQSISVKAVGPVTVPSKIPSTGCDRMTFRVDDDRYPTSGAVDRIPAPTIDGATTIGLKVQTDDQPYPVYSFAAVLDDGAYVDVQARLAPDFQAEPVLSALLVKAVAAIRSK